MATKKLGRKNFPAELFVMLFLICVVIQRIPQQELIYAGIIQRLHLRIDLCFSIGLVESRTEVGSGEILQPRSADWRRFKRTKQLVFNFHIFGDQFIRV